MCIVPRPRAISHIHTDAYGNAYNDAYTNMRVLVYKRKRVEESMQARSRSRWREHLRTQRTSIGVACGDGRRARKERLEWRSCTREIDAANWLSPITFIHLKPTLPGYPGPSLLLASFPPFFIPFRVHHAPLSLSSRSNSTRRATTDQPLTLCSPTLARPSHFSRARRGVTVHGALGDF